MVEAKCVVDSNVVVDDKCMFEVNRVIEAKCMVNGTWVTYKIYGGYDSVGLPHTHAYLHDSQVSVPHGVHERGGPVLVPAWGQTGSDVY